MNEKISYITGVRIMIKNIYKLVILSALLVILCAIVLLQAEDSYYYSENTGWHNYKNIAVTGNTLTGWVWCENIGWIRLDPRYGGVSIDREGNCSGYAYGENVGWINFSPIYGGVKVGFSKESLNGWAWGENIGWIRFDGKEILDFSNNDLKVLPNYVKAGSIDNVKIVLGEIKNPAEYYRVMIYTITGRNLVIDLGEKSYTELTRGVVWLLKDENNSALSRGLYLIIVKNGDTEYTRDLYYSN